MNNLTTHNSLPARLDAASRAIAACTDMSEIKQMNDQAAALVAATAAMKCAPELVTQATRVKNEALLRLGEILNTLKNEAVYKGYANVLRSERGEAIKKYGISSYVATAATRLAAGGTKVRKLVLKAKTTSPTALARLAPATRTRNGTGKNPYDDALSREFMSKMALALCGLRAGAAMPLRGVSALDKPRLRKATVEAQELLDSIEQMLE